MANRAYEYTTHTTAARGEKVDTIESVINEYAAEGWRLVETLEDDGTTVGLVFERER